MKRRPVIDFEKAFQRWKGRARRGVGDDFLILDLGNANLNSLYAKLGRVGELLVVDYAAAPTRGFSDGSISKPPQFQAAVERVLMDLRKRNRVRTRRLNVSISAPFISYFNHFTTVNMPARRRVTQKLLDGAIKQARDEISSLVENVIQVVPVRYTLDSIYTGGDPPLGMRGQQLGIELFLLTAPRQSVEQIEKALRGCGYSIESWWYAGLSAAESVLMPSAEAGVAVVDIGGGVTDVAVYHHGRLLHVGVIDGGGSDFDADLAVFLNESKTVAEEVKRLFGCALPQVIRYNEVIDLKERGLGTEKLVSAREIAAVIRDRAQELFYSVEEEVSKGLSPDLLSKIVFTGGAVKLAGLAELAEMVINKKAEVGIPRAVNGTRVGFSDPGCAALVGTLKMLRSRLLARRRFEVVGMTAMERFRAWVGALVSSSVSEEREVV